MRAHTMIMIHCSCVILSVMHVSDCRRQTATCSSIKQSAVIALRMHSDHLC